MKWARAVHHVESLAHSCADMATKPASIFAFRATQLWAVGDILGPPRDVEVVTVALCVDLPVDDVPWCSEPLGAQHWANAARLAKNPVLPWWRSAHAPVWNHRIVRPVKVWDDSNGLHEDALAAISEGRAESIRPPAPASDVFRERMREELKVSLRSLRSCTATYEDRRWSPGKIGPVADDLWRASDGYLDALDAMQSR